ncbi:putative transcription factor & chromatin remodeling ARID family [Helianthus annuus]|nr:putative transcription factor & chromatin remodeling ARID family [Helianthus annuus]
MEKNPLESREEMRRKAVSKAQDEEDVIEKDTIIESCLDVLDLIILHEEVAEHKGFFKASMKEIVTLFIPCYFGICKTGEMPPTLLNGKPVDLVALYKVVKEYGGFKKVVQDNAWNKVDVQCGFDCDDDFEVKVAYVRYIELVEWYFELMKTKRERNEDNTHEAGSSGAKVDQESKVVDEKRNGWIDDSSDDDLVIVVDVTTNNDTK